MFRYSYNGPVYYFDTCVVTRWKTETIASSEKKARSNFAYRWKKENGYAPNAKISLPGTILPVEHYDTAKQLAIKL